MVCGVKKVNIGWPIAERFALLRINEIIFIKSIRFKAVIN